ncbi:MAG TPA: nickel ABC transporter permease [Egibacteraceae bacterium]|nr:nickel ABC transporter permease [Egibacteraceae bacterium]
MTAYALRRILLLVPTLIGISLLGFALANLAPGDPAVQYVIRTTDAQPTPERVAAARDQLGLDLPLPAQYVKWLGDAVAGDLGVSYATRRPVTAELGQRIRPTVELAVPAAVLALVVALPMGAISALYRNRLADQVVRVGAIAGASMPSFWLAMLLMTFLAVRIPLFPVAGRSGIASVVLPVVVLAATPTAILARFTRSAVLEVAGEDYVVTARAKGLKERRVVGRHIVRTSLIAIVTAFGTSLGHLLSGTVVIETVFAWPGLGRLAVAAIDQRDYPMIQGFVVYAGLLFVVLNLLVDLSYAAIDPRVRLSGARAEAT